jgi:glycine reductase
MTKAIEQVGLPTVIVCAITSIAKVVHAPRIVRAISIPHPFGDPSLSPKEELKVRHSIIIKALKAISTPVDK